MIERKKRSRGRATRSSSVVLYVETSALLAALLEGDADARKTLRASLRRISSALTFAEARRAIVRARAGGRLDAAQEQAALRAIDGFERRCDSMAITEAVLARAGRPYPVEPIRTLDALHLATAESLGAPGRVTVLTRDLRVRQNAEALGFRVR